MGFHQEKLGEAARYVQRTVPNRSTSQGEIKDCMKQSLHARKHQFANIKSCYDLILRELVS